MTNDAKLVDLGANVRSIRCTRTGEMIFKLKCDKERKCAAYKSLAEEVLAKGVEIRAPSAEATVRVKNLDEVTDTTTAVRLRKGQAGTQEALVQLPVTDANKSVKVGKLKVG